MMRWLHDIFAPPKEEIDELRRKAVACKIRIAAAERDGDSYDADTWRIRAKDYLQKARDIEIGNADGVSRK